MSIQEILKISEVITAVNAGHVVNWSSEIYEVRTEVEGSTDPKDFYVICTVNGSIHGFVNKRTGEMLADPSEFGIKGKFEFEAGDSAWYSVMSFGGKVHRVDVEVLEVSDGNFPAIKLNNGHTARWNGFNFIMEDIDNCSVLLKD